MGHEWDLGRRLPPRNLSLVALSLAAGGGVGAGWATRDQLERL